MHLRVESNDYKNDEYLQVIDFDVATTSSEEVEAGASLGIIIAPLLGKANTKYDLEDSRVNRIRFSIPVELPKQEKVYPE